MLKYFRFTLSILYKYLLVNKKNIVFGHGVYVSTTSKVLPGKGKIVIGDLVELRSEAKGYHAGMPFPTTILVDKENAMIEIGAKTRLNGVYIHAQKEIRIGKNCVVAAGVNILDSNGHLLISTDRTQGRDDPESIIIGDNVWVGLNSVILKGTVIGKNSVVGANSVVKGIFQENSLILGNPAKTVKILEIEGSDD